MSDDESLIDLLAAHDRHVNALKAEIRLWRRMVLIHTCGSAVLVVLMVVIWRSC